LLIPPWLSRVGEDDKPVSTGIAPNGTHNDRMFVFTTSTIVWRSRVLPTWLAVLGYVFGLILFVAPLVIRPLGFAFPVWVFVVSTVLLIVRPTGDL
jgi:hypothetical protein